MSNMPIKKKASLSSKIYHKLPEGFRDTLLLRLFGLFKVPMLFICAPRVVRLDDNGCVIKIPLKRRNQNHLKSMYFGVLACGADCAGGLSAMRQIMLSGTPINLVFKEFKAEFLKRPMNDVYFTCNDGKAISLLVDRAQKSGERENLEVEVLATEPKQFGQEPVAKFTLTLSLKRK